MLVLERRNGFGWFTKATVIRHCHGRASTFMASNSSMDGDADSSGLVARLIGLGTSWAVMPMNKEARDLVNIIMSLIQHQGDIQICITVITK